MSSPRTPSKRSLARVHSMGSSFTSCFGASTPISPRRSGGYGLLGGQVSVNYRKLGFHEDEDEDEDTYASEAEGRYEHVSQRREEPSLQQAYKNGMHYALEGEEVHARERETAMKLGTKWTMREKTRLEVYYASETPKVEEPYASEQEGNEHVRERKGIMKLAKLWSMREKDSICNASGTPKKLEHYHARDEEDVGVYVRERKSVMKLGKLWSMREKARRDASETAKEEEQNGASEEEIDGNGRERKGDGKQLSMREKEGGRESLSRKVREACVQVFESARRSSPHLSELFVGNQLLMQVTSSTFNARRARNVAPSAGFLVAGGDSPLYILSPPRSSSSSSF